MPRSNSPTERYDLPYRLYEGFGTDTLQAYQELVDLFHPVDSRVVPDRLSTLD